MLAADHLISHLWIGSPQPLNESISLIFFILLV
jgi:hypothetical protein